jgi:hypothetical protein
MKRLSPGVVATLLFGSGLAALVYQTAWQRMLSLVFGATTAASSAVLAVFLGGLGLGGWLLGGRAERHGRPLLLYGTLELLVAGSAAVSPFLVDGLTAAYLALGGSPRLGSGGATIARLVLTALALGPAVVLMGGTLPAAVRAAESDADHSRRRLAWLYGANTAGAVVGALIGTFVLFEAVGTRSTLWIAVGLNVLVALVARLLGARQPAADEAPSAPKHESLGSSPAAGEAGRSEPAPGDSLPFGLVYAVAAVTGAVFVALELVWYRMLAPLLGGTTFAFGLVLAVALSGIGVGGALYTLRASSRRPGAGLLALTLVLEAGAVALPLALGDRLALFAGYLRDLNGLGFAALVSSWTLVTTAVVFLPSLIAGLQFPVLVALLGAGRRGVARELGLTYAMNTAGSIVGALLAGFVLFPAVGVVPTWRAAALLLLGAGAVVASAPLVARARTRRHGLGRVLLPSTVGLLLAAAVLALALAPGPSAVWRHSGIGAGRAQLPRAGRFELEAWLRRQRKAILWEQDGAELSLGLEVARSAAFIVGGKNDGSIWGDRATQAGAAVLPALVHPSPRRMFIVGLGTGMSAGWAAALPDVEHVTVAELDPVVERVAFEARLANQRVLERSDVRVIHGDAREILLTSADRYDVIFSEPSNPYRAGIANLFTQDFYRHARARLLPGGFFAQWLQGYEVDAATIRSALATLRSVFAEVEVWHTIPNDLVLIARKTPAPVDADLLREKLKGGVYRDVLRRAWLVDDLEGVLGRRLAAPTLVDALLAAYHPRVNTDDHNLLEYAFAKTVGTDSMIASLDLAALSQQTRPSPAEGVRGAVDWDRVARLSFRDAMASPLELYPRLPADETERASAFVAVCHGASPWQGPALERLLVGEPRDFVELVVRTEAAAALGREAFRQALPELRREGFSVEAELAEALFARHQRDAERTTEHLLRALRELQSQALPLCDASEQVLALLNEAASTSPALARRAVEALLEGPLAAWQSELRRRRVAQSLAFGLHEEPSLCLRALGPELELPWWEEAFLDARRACLTRTRHPLALRASAEFDSLLTSLPGELDGSELLGPQ